MADDPEVGSLAFNANPAPDLAGARAQAQARATAIQQPVDIFEHVGGRHPKKGKVAPLGTFLVRDRLDPDVITSPKFVWQYVETVQP